MAETVTVTRITALGVQVTRHMSRLLAEAHVASMRFLDKSRGEEAVYELSDSSPRVGSG